MSNMKLAITAIVTSLVLSAPACSDSESTAPVAAVADTSVQVDIGSEVSVDVTTPPADAGDSGAPGETADGPVDASSTEAVVKIVPLSTAAHDRFRDVAFDSAGAFFATGEMADVVVPDSGAPTPDFKTIVAKFKADGTLDSSFGTGGFVSKNLVAAKDGEVARGVVVQSTGKIVVAATVDHVGGADARDRDVALCRFNADGTVDTTFGTAGVLTFDLSDGGLAGTRYLADTQWGLYQFTDGKLLVSGSLVHRTSAGDGGTDTFDNDQFLLKLTADGARDASFGANGLATVDIDRRSQNGRAAMILSDGSIVAGGYMTDGDGNIRPAVYKVTSAGVLDKTFGTGGIFNDLVLAFQSEAYAIAPQGDNLVTVGYGKRASADKLDWVSIRLSAAGVRDGTFGNVDVGGKKLVLMDLKNDDQARSLLVLDDKRIVLAGGQDQASTSRTADGAYAILSKDGAVTSTKVVDFGGARDFISAVAMSPSKAFIVMAGIKGANPDIATENDDAALVILPTPR